MADVYATVDDVKGLWPDFPPGAEQHAGKLLGFAAAIIRAEAGDVSGVDPELLKLVSCEMVVTAMKSPGEGANVSSMNMAAGPFSQQISYRADADDLFLTRKHRKWLGVGRQRAFSVDLLAGHHVP